MKVKIEFMAEIVEEIPDDFPIEKLNMSIDWNKELVKEVLTNISSEDAKITVSHYNLTVVT